MFFFLFFIIFLMLVPLSLYTCLTNISIDEYRMYSQKNKLPKEKRDDLKMMKRKTIEILKTTRPHRVSEEEFQKQLKKIIKEGY